MKQFIFQFFQNSYVRLVASLLIAFIIFRGYIRMDFWEKEILVLRGNALYVELPLILLILLLLYFPNRNFLKTLIGGAVVLALYVVHDAFGVIMKRAPRVSDLENLGALFDVSLPLVSVIVLFIVLLIGIVVYGATDFIRQSSRNTIYKHFAFKVVLISAMAVFAYSGGAELWILKRYDASAHAWTVLETMRKNGRFSTLMYDYYRSREARSKLHSFVKEMPQELNQAIFGNPKIEKRNIYIVVMESFLDPRLIEGNEFSRDPLAESLKRYLPDGNFSHCKSPVYGGNTAQAEFELLTATPALAKLGTTEFNMLGGRESGSLVSLLKQLSYKTYANIASNHTYFNSPSAYASIGFDEVHYLEEGYGVKRDGDVWIFDGDLFDYALQRLSELPKDRPYLFYTLGMYGHAPFHRNKEFRPDVIRINQESEWLESIANQFYYRTEALSRYIEGILRLDKGALIFITSDHLPGVINGETKYSKEIHENICMLLDAGKPVAFPLMSHYQIPRLLLETLGAELPPISDYEELYYRLIANSWR